MAASIDAKISPKVDPQALKRAGKKLGDGLERAGKQAAKDIEKELQKHTKKGAKKGTKTGIKEGASEGMSVFKGSFFGSMLGNIAGGIGGMISDGIMSGLEGAEEVVERMRNRFDQSAQINNAAKNLGLNSGDLYKMVAAYKVSAPEEDASGFMGILGQYGDWLNNDNAGNYKKVAQDQDLLASLQQFMAYLSTVKDPAQRSQLASQALGEDDAVKLNGLLKFVGDYYEQNKKVPTSDQIGKGFAGIKQSSESISQKLQAMADGQKEIAQNNVQNDVKNLMSTNVGQATAQVQRLDNINNSLAQMKEKTADQRISWEGMKAQMEGVLSEGGDTIITVLKSIYEGLQPFFEWIKNATQYIKPTVITSDMMKSDFKSDVGWEKSMQALKNGDLSMDIIGRMKEYFSDLVNTAEKNAQHNNDRSQEVR